MKIIRDYHFVKPEDQGATAAIGNFDGVHLGHQSVIKLAKSALPDAPLGIVTFEPHPRAYFTPDTAPFRLMSQTARTSQLEKLGVNSLYELPFNAEMATLSPREFAERIICEGLGLSHIVIGADFSFGNKRAGSANDLVGFGAEMGFGVTIAPLLEQSVATISSTAIRQTLSDGRPHDAAEMLGHWHRIEGPVIAGEQRGRTLGYPTANMSIDGLLPPAFGVYAVLVDVLDGPHQGQFHGVSSLGKRPMFGENHPNLETFLFNFSGDLYGSCLSIALVDYLREEEKFQGLEALVTQMDSDSARAQCILAAL
mgnify:FL=1